MKVDHVVLLTRQLEELAGAFENLGFTLTPLGEHGPVFGTANRCITFADHYVELLGVRADTQANAPLRAFLEHSAAVGMVSMLSTDIDASHKDLQQRGVMAQPPFHISRQMGASAEDSSLIEFAVLMPLPGPETEVPNFFTMQKTPQSMFASRWREHPNGATRLACVEIEVHDPNAAAKAYERVGSEVAADGARRVVVQSDPQVALAPIGSLALGQRSPERTAVLTIAVASLDGVRRTLAERKVACREVDGALITDIPGERRCAVRFTGR